MQLRYRTIYHEHELRRFGEVTEHLVSANPLNMRSTSLLLSAVAWLTTTTTAAVTEAQLQHIMVQQ
jgi:hypothetical protein